MDLRNRDRVRRRAPARHTRVRAGRLFVTYLGWLYRWGAPLTLIGDDTDQIADARRELVRIGIDELDGAAIGDIDSLRRWHRAAVVPCRDFADLAKVLGNEASSGPRRPSTQRERAAGIPGALNIPLHELLDRIDEIPEGEVWVHCASGYRRPIAASMIDRPERTVVLVDDDYDNAATAGLEDERPADGADTAEPAGADAR